MILKKLVIIVNTLSLNKMNNIKPLIDVIAIPNRAIDFGDSKILSEYCKFFKLN